MASYVKERPRPEPGSIPALLGMFENELRFYREIAPEVGVRVPALYRAEETERGFRLEIEDLSAWPEGADPGAAAGALAALHRRWEGEAHQRFPWLERAGRGADVIGELYDRVWKGMSDRPDLTQSVTRLGSSLVGQVARLEREEARGDRLTLIHGDASLRNMRTSADGVVAFVDWEDVRSAAGEVDLAWLLVSSTEPTEWPGAIAAYDPDRDELLSAMPAAAAQGLLSLSDVVPGSDDSRAWVRRLGAAAAFLA